MSGIEETLLLGTQLHQAGRFAEAEQAYRRVLSADPNHPRALHQLGLLAMQARRYDIARELIGQAVRADRSQAAFHANLGEVFRQLGQGAEAAESYRRAIALDPKLGQVHTALGILLHDQGKLAEAAGELREALRQQSEDTLARLRLAQVLDGLNQFRDAEVCYRRVLRTDERSIDANFGLASTLHSMGRAEEAMAGYRATLALKPDHVDAHNNLGTLLNAQGHSEAARAHFETALRFQPSYAPAHVNLGRLLHEERRYAEAARHYQAALASDPRSVVGQHNLGAVLEKLGRADEALVCYQEAVRLDPTHAASVLGIAHILQQRGEREQAIALCREAIRLQPELVEAYNNLCVTYADDGLHDEAIAAARAALQIRPDYSWSHSNLAVSLQALGLLDEAIAHHRQSLLTGDDCAGPHSNLLYALNYHPEVTAEALFAEHREWGRRHADPLTARAVPFLKEPSGNPRLRIGYVSPHFRAHAVNFFVEPILASHNHGEFEVFCYSDVEQEDEVTERLKSFADHWRSTVNLTDEELAQRIREDQIEILVDLTGHISGGKRMLTFARKPAPIQVTYLGYQNTTGMLAMDYRLTDAYSDPLGTTDGWYTEQLVRLPRAFFCYLPSPDAPAVVPPPSLAAGLVTFGSINNFTKVTPQVLEAWTRILGQVPNSRLLLRADMTPSLAERLQAFFAQRGIGPDRLELINRLPRARYLELIQRMDIALDPFPFNGHTTTCDCLWQGVPVVTLSGTTYVQRFGGSGLAVLGLDDLIAQSGDEYVQIAVRLAGDPERLTRERATLRERMAASPLLDFVGFTRNLEAAYRQMFADWLS